MEPWQQYLEALQRGAERIPPRAFGRGELLSEIAHDAYQTTTDQLTASGMDGERALTITRLLNQVTKRWIGNDGEDWEMLRGALRDGYASFTAPSGRREEQED